MQLKAVKNEAEIENEKKAHILDGVAMTNFLYWLKTNVGKEYMDELKLGDRLEDFRNRAESYIEPSFAPIVGYNEHGAIVHYSATKGSNVVIKTRYCTYRQWWTLFGGNHRHYKNHKFRKCYGKNEKKCIRQCLRDT